MFCIQLLKRFFAILFNELLPFLRIIENLFDFIFVFEQNLIYFLLIPYEARLSVLIRLRIHPRHLLKLQVGSLMLIWFLGCNSAIVLHEQLVGFEHLRNLLLLLLELILLTLAIVAEPDLLVDSG